MIINLKTIALLTPVFVTLFWAIILFARNRSLKNPGFYIALLMLCFFLLFTSILPFYTGNLKLYLSLESLFFLSLCLIFPLIYMYIRSVTLREIIKSKDYLHFLPALLFGIISSVLHLFLSAEGQHNYVYGHFSLDGTWAEVFIYALNYSSKVVVLAQIVFYFILCVNLILAHKEKVKDYFSGLNRFYFNWIRIFFIAYPGASLLGMFMLLQGNRELNESEDLIIIIVLFLLSSVFFFIAYLANHQRYIENDEFYSKLLLNQINSNGSFQTFAMKNKLEDYFNREKPFLNPDLKITDVAHQLKTNRTYISQTIKEEYRTNFSSFVNAYRIKEADFLFRNQAYHLHTTVSIAETSGFNNYNSFVKAFRLEKGITPGKYRKLL